VLQNTIAGLLYEKNHLFNDGYLFVSMYGGMWKGYEKTEIVKLLYDLTEKAG